MEGRTSPLRIPELLDHCIDHLHDSPTDLSVCALVSRCWLHPAQSRLFHSVSLINHPQSIGETLWVRLHDALRTSPHLIRYVHQFRADTTAVSHETLSSICHFPFTHLKTAALSAVKEVTPPIASIQQLLRLHTLQRVALYSYIPDPVAFSQIWESLSPTVKHLDWMCGQHNQEPLSSRRPGALPIRLESLRLIVATDASNWLTQPGSPFDFSSLRVLSVAGLQTFGFKHLFSAVPALEVLDFTLTGHDIHVDLSCFPKLSLVRMTRAGLDSLSSIGATNRIRKIIFHGFIVDEETCVELDGTLSGLPLGEECTIVLTMKVSEYDRLVPSFQKSSSKMKFRQADPNFAWFEDFVTTVSDAPYHIQR
ncbi:hypothetical protein C8R43DRAFT_43797 [Mycena crocata]|nr:hypothetical protein C8R43DRAFT_43797 [Mycena crocata]